MVVGTVVVGSAGIDSPVDESGNESGNESGKDSGKDSGNESVGSVFGGPVVEMSSEAPHPYDATTVRTENATRRTADCREALFEPDARLMTGGYAHLMSPSPQPPSPIVDSPTEWVADHIARYVATGGEDGHNWNGVPCMLLTTKGRRSGRWVRSALIYGRDGDDIVLVASKGGAPDNPLWYENLVSHPDVWVQVGPDTWWGRAEVVDPATESSERSRLWGIMTPIWPSYDEYQHKAGARIIPVVRVRRG